MKMNKDLYLLLCFVSVTVRVASFNPDYFNDVCSNVTARNYDTDVIQKEWQQWILDGHVEIRCVPFVLCPPGSAPLQPVLLTAKDVGSRKFTKPCDIYFKQSPKNNVRPKTFGQIVRLLQGIHSLQIGSTPPMAWKSFHYGIHIPFGQATYTFNIQLQGKGMGQFLMYFYPANVRGGAIDYDKSAERLDRIMFKNSKKPTLVEKNRFNTMVQLVHDLWNRPTTRLEKWPKKGQNEILGEHFDQILDFHMIYFLAESVFPIEPWTSKLKNMCQLKKGKNRPTIDDAYIAKAGWLTQQSGRTPEIFEKTIHVELQYAAAGSQGALVGFEDFIAKLPSHGILFQKKGGTGLQRLQFISDLFGLNLAESDLVRLARKRPPKPAANTAALQVAAAANAATQVSTSLGPVGQLSFDPTVCIVTRSRQKQIDMLGLGQALKQNQLMGVGKGKGGGKGKGKGKNNGNGKGKTQGTAKGTAKATGKGTAKATAKGTAKGTGLGKGRRVVVGKGKTAPRKGKTNRP